MTIKTIHEIHKDYVNSGVSLIRESQGLENKELLQELLTELSQEYVKTVFGTVEKVKISAEEARQRDLLSSQELKQKFFEDIAKETNIDVKAKNAKQLVDALFSENIELSIEQDEDVLKPRILGTVENIGTIILPPDILEIIIGSGRGWEQRETPVGFDKIGMVEERLSSKLGRERTTFHWKMGILNDNQMRKVSYYHLYLPEYDKTILLNNQYGEGAFVVKGNFNIREARKSDLKGSKEAVMIKFDYEHPEEFLERLGISLSQGMVTNNQENEMISDNNLNIKENIPKIGEDGKVEINGEIYQWVGQATPSGQLWGMSGEVGNRRVQNKIKEDIEWGVLNIKQAKLNGRAVQVVKLSELERLIKASAELKEIGEDGKVEINGEIYQWVGARTPERQLRGMKGVTAIRRVKSKLEEDNQWGELNVKQVKGSNGKEVQVVKLSELGKLIKTSAELKEIGEDGKAEIDGEIYQRVGMRTPEIQLRGMGGETAAKRIKKKLEVDSSWGEKNIKIAKLKGREVQVVKLSELEKLIKTSAELKEIGEDGKVEIDGEKYQWVGARTPERQLLGMQRETVANRIKKKVEIDNSWGELNAKQAKLNGRAVQVIKLSELERLIKALAELKEIGEDGKVEIDGEIYQRVGARTPERQLRGMKGVTAVNRVKSKLEEDSSWGEKNIKIGKLKGLEVQVIKVSELAHLIKNSAEKKKLGENGRVEIDGEIYQRVGYHTPEAQLRGMKGQAATDRIKREIKKSSKWGEGNVKQVKGSNGKEVQVVKLSELKELLGKS